MSIVCVVPVSTCVDDVAVIDGSVDGGGVVALAKDVIIARPDTEKYTNMPTNISFQIRSIRNMTTTKSVTSNRLVTKKSANNEANRFFDSNVTSAFCHSCLSQLNAFNLIILRTSYAANINFVEQLPNCVDIVMVGVLTVLVEDDADVDVDVKHA